MMRIDFNNLLNFLFHIIKPEIISDDFKFFNTDTQYLELPFNLIERNQSITWSALIGLSLSFVLLALSRFGSSNFILIFSKILYKNNSINKIIEDEYNLSSIGSILLIINYIVSSTTLLYLSIVSFYFKEYSISFIFLPLLPLFFLFWPLFWYSFVGFITNEKEVFSENKKNIIVLVQIMGILFSILLLLWTFNLKWTYYFTYTLIFLIGFFWIYKIFRGIIFSFQHKVSWYYIILYFCTLEILPILTVYELWFTKISV